MTKPVLMKEFKKLHIPDPDEFSADIPSIGISSFAKIKISGGSFTPTGISFSNMQQELGGNFSMEASISGKLHFKNWHEEDTIVTAGFGGFSIPQHSKFDSSEFIITFSTILIKISVHIKLDKDNGFAPSVTDAKVLDKKFKYTLPKKTALEGSILSCVKDKVDSTIRHKISDMTNSIVSSLNSSLNEAFEIIPESGKLTSTITFIFSGTPHGLQFPSNNNGVQYRVVGKVRYEKKHKESKSAPGDIGTVPFPEIPTDRDALFHVNNYEFNALFWAFYENGDLNFSFNQDNVTPKAGLSTDYFEPSPLSKAYPHRDLIIDVELTQHPTVLLRAGEAEISYSAILTYWITKKGSDKDKEKEVLKISINETDNLDGFAVSTKVDSGLQSLTFNVSVESKNLESKIISTNIDGLNDSQMMENLWKFMLHPTYATVLDKAANSGIPLPSALQGIFKDCKISIMAGYASVAINFGSLKLHKNLLRAHYPSALTEEMFVENFSF